MEGYLKKIPVRRNRVLTTSVNGVLDESYTRANYEYDCIITEINKLNYDELCEMFLRENRFLIDDVSQGISDGYFMLDYEEIPLQEIEDKSGKEFYYTGSLRLRRV
jgi:hypothetical protein